MEPALLATLVVASVALVAVVVLAVLLVTERRRTARQFALHREEIAALVADRQRAVSVAATTPAVAEFVITDIGGPAGTGRTASRDGRSPVDAESPVISAALGEPVIRAWALAHGVRRALSGPSRNRIRFAVKREVRRSRRDRRREMRAAWRRERAAGAPGAPGADAA